MPLQCAICGGPFTQPKFQLPQSPFSKIIGGNDRLPSSQVTAAQEMISKWTLQIQQLGEQIIQIHRHVDTLRQQCHTLQSHLTLHKALIAPISRLPPEILAEIFLHCVEAKWLDIPPTISKRSDIRLDKSPCRLAGTCRRWRIIAHSTPRLWSCIALVLRPKHVKPDVEFTKIWLDRSVASPLSICLESDGAFKSDLQPLMELFASCCHRWRNVRVCLPSNMTRRLSSVKDHLMALQWLFIVTQNELLPLEMFSVAPQLRHLFFDETVSSPSFIVPWSQLQSCVMASSCSAQTYLDILSLTSNIENFSLDLSTATHNHPPRSVHLQSLRSLKFKAQRGLDAAVFLDALDLPSLCNLSYINLSPEYNPCPHLPSLLSRCALKSLTFQTHLTFDAPDGRNDMLEILLQTPQLVDLNIINGGSGCLSHEFLASFVNGLPGSVDIIPLLETLTLHVNPYQRGFDMSLFIDGLESRMNMQNGVILKSVDITLIIYNENQELPIFLARLRQLQNSGLDLHVSRMGRGNLL